MHSTHTRTRLRLEGVPSPVVTHVVRRSGDRVTLRQPLPFLQLDGMVEDERGRRGRIARVDVSLEGNLPSLVLEVAYAAEVVETAPPEVPSARAPSPRRDATVPFELPSVRNSSAPPIAVGAPAAPAWWHPAAWWTALTRWLRRRLPLPTRAASPRLPAHANRQ
jgi:hypothetical protein